MNFTPTTHIGPFWWFSEGGRFIILGQFACFRRAVDLLFSPISAVFGGR